MKTNYPIITFMTGILLIAGVLFVHVYDSASAIAIAPRTADFAAATDPSTSTLSGAGTGSSGPVIPSSGEKRGSGDTSTATRTNGSASTVPVSNPSGFANGTYASAYPYLTPGGEERIGISLTVANGVVTDASVQNSSNNHDSSRFQNAFAGSYRPYVIGKSLASLSLNRISGASLTTAAFNAAIDSIRAQAS